MTSESLSHLLEPPTRWFMYKQHNTTKSLSQTINRGAWSGFIFQKPCCRNQHSPLPAPFRTGSLLNILQLLPSLHQLGGSAAAVWTLRGKPLHPRRSHTCPSCDGLLIALQRGKNKLARKNRRRRRPKNQGRVGRRERKPLRSVSPQKTSQYAQAFPKVPLDSHCEISALLRTRLNPGDDRLLLPHPCCYHDAYFHFPLIL